MAKGKLILICQSGGEFVTNDDGTMSYNGGEANATNVTTETPFNILKLNLAEICDLNQETVTVKYFLPGNKRNLITVKNDKDVKRMIDFHGDAITAEVFVTGTTGFNRSEIINSDIITKNDVVVEKDNLIDKKDENVEQRKVGPKKVKKEDKLTKSQTAIPVRLTRQSAAKIEASSRKKEIKKRKRKQKTVSNHESEQVNVNVDLDYSSDCVLSQWQKVNSQNEKKVNASPDGGVKKRKRTPTWKVGANGSPTIVSDHVGSKSKGSSGIKKSQRKSGKLAVKGDDDSQVTKSGRKRGRPRAIITNDQENDDYVGPACDVDLILKDFGVESKSNELHGFDKDAYNKLPWFCEKVKVMNPGSISNLVIDENKRFKGLFMSFYASLCGFQNSCRPLLFLEASSLRSIYGEVLFTANAIDGNDDFFIIAFAIVDVEDDNNWHWFLEQLKAAIFSSQQSISFVFDREKNLKPYVNEAFQDSYIGYSIYHLLESFKRNIKGPFHGDGKSGLLINFLDAAHAVRFSGYKKSTEQIKQISSQAYDWVMQIEPQHWTTSSFKGERYNYIVDDIRLPLSKLMDDYQDLSILHKLDAIIHMMIDGINDAQLDGSMWSTHLTPIKEKQLQEETIKSCGLKVLISSDTLFEVREDSTHVVDIGNWSCTCLRWKETGLPCRHALAVFTLTGKNAHEFCSSYFTVDAYRLTYMESITPVPSDKDEGEKMEIGNTGGENGEKMEMEIEIEIVGGENEEGGKVDDEKEEVEKDEGVVVLPPIPAKTVDVMKEKNDWIDEIEVETKRTVTCTKCKQTGHNKKSCNFYQVEQAC